LRLVNGSTREIAFQKREAELQRHGPVLQITYALPQPEGRPQFHRGDPDGSGNNDISDPVHLLVHLFLGGPEGSCRESADSNNDAVVDIADALGMLFYLFLGSNAPAAPGSSSAVCGTDPDPAGSVVRLQRP
jgi:hypothetical protein